MNIMSLIDYLKKAIKKSGYPLEIEISSLLRARWPIWSVLHQESFLDEDEMKTRHIDLSVLCSFDLRKLEPWLFIPELDIECKKSESFAWIFFTVRTEYEPLECIDGQYLDELQICLKDAEITNLRDLVLRENLHYHRFERFAITFDEFHLKGKKKEYDRGKKEIFEAQKQLEKFIAYAKERYIGGKPVSDLKRIFVYFPCIVFDGRMFEAIVENGNLDLRKCNHIVLFTQHIHHYSHSYQNFLIDIVHRSYFDQYLKEIERDIKSLAEIIAKNRRKLLNVLKASGCSESGK